MNPKQLLKRLVTFTVAMAFITNGLFNPWIAFVFMTILVGVSSGEFLGLCEKMPIRKLETGWRVAYSAMCIGIMWSAWFGSAAVHGATLVAMILIAIIAVMRSLIGSLELSPGSLGLVVALMAGIIYIPFTQAHSLALPSRIWTFYVIVLTGTGENAALVFGLLFGRRKVVGSLSPHKTEAGFIAQVVGTVLASIVWTLVLPHTSGDLGRPWPLEAACYFGVINAVVSIFGDLFSSFLKRCVDQKDWGSLLPGVGGVLDRVNGLALAFPAAWVFLRLTEGMF